MNASFAFYGPWKLLPRFKHWKISKQTIVFLQHLSSIYAYKKRTTRWKKAVLQQRNLPVKCKILNSEERAWLCLVTIWGWFSVSISSSYAFLPLYIDSPPDYGLVTYQTLVSLQVQVSPQCSPLLVLTAAVSSDNPSVLQIWTEKRVSRK